MARCCWARIERAYLTAWELAGSGRAICSVDAKGNRGPLTILRGITGRLEAVEDHRAVLVRHTGNGTEWVVQGLL